METLISQFIVEGGNIFCKVIFSSYRLSLYFQITPSVWSVKFYGPFLFMFPL